MTIANVALNNTFDEWRIKTNQLIYTINDIESVALYTYTTNNPTVNVTSYAIRGGTIWINVSPSLSYSDTSTLNIASANVVNLVYSTAFQAFNAANISFISSNNAANSSNAYAVTIGDAANSYAESIGAAANAYIRVYANNAADAANTYADNKLANTSGTLFNGDLLISGNVTVNSGTIFVNKVNQRVGIGITNPLYKLDVAGSINASSVLVNGSPIDTGGITGGIALAYNQANTAFDKANAANVLAYNTGIGSNAFTYVYANNAANSSNLYTDGKFYTIANGSAAFDKANAANVLAYNTSIGSNAYTVTVGAASNAYTVSYTNVYANGVANALNVVHYVYANGVANSSNLYTNVYANNTANALNVVHYVYANGVANSSNSFVEGKFYTIANGSAAFSFANGVNSNVFATASYANTNHATYAYANSVGVSSNIYGMVFANSVANSSNLYTNVYANGVANSSNAYAGAVGVSSNAFTYVYANGVANSSNSFVEGKFYTIANGSAAFDKANLSYAKTGGLISGDVTITGNLTITGNTVFTNTQTLLIGDNILTLNAELPSGIAPGENAGIEVNRGNKNSNAAFLWIEATEQWGFTSNNLNAVTTYLASNTYTVSVGAASNTWANTKVSSVSGTSGRITSSGGTTPAIDLSTAGAGAASYSSGISSITVDAYGRVTSVSGSAGYVTSSGVTSVATGTGLTGGTITSTGTISLASGVVTAQSAINGISSITVDTYGRITGIVGGAGYVTSSGVTSVSGTSGRITSSGGTTPAIDLASGVVTAQTASSGISSLTIDTYGRVTGIVGGAGYVTSSGVTSVSGTSPVSSSGGTTPAISLASGYGDTQNPFASKTANYFLAAPNGTSGAPTFRAIVAADIPTLNQNTTGSAGTFTSTTQNSQFNSIGVGTAAAATAGDIRATADITAYYSSDERLKENIVPIENALDIVNKINGVSYDWTDEYIERKGGEDGYFVRKHDIGVIAQEIEKVLPEIVAERDDGYKAVRYERLVSVLIEAVKELDERVKQLEAK